MIWAKLIDHYKCFMSAFGQVLNLWYLRKIKKIHVFMPELPTSLFAQWRNPVYVGWGRKKSGMRAAYWSMLRQQPLFLLEDGFLRSVGLGRQGAQPVSLVVDTCGIYYDAYHASDLERYIHEPADHARAALLMQEIVRRGLSKYNHAPMLNIRQHLQLAHNKPIVLIVDQTRGDASVRYAGASSSAFDAMLQRANALFADAYIVVKTHPDANASVAKGYYQQTHRQQYSHIQWLAQDCDAAALIQQVDVIFTVSSQMGFEALLQRKVVYCFAAPWYAGWGLTDDQFMPEPVRHIIATRRGGQKKIEQLVYAAYIRYTRYVHPIQGVACKVEQVLDWFSRNKYWNNVFRPALVFEGLTPRKRIIFKQFFEFPSVTIATKAAHISPESSTQHIMRWGVSTVLSQTALLQTRVQTRVQTTYWTAEDGFIRSVGLGAALVPPLSLAVDNVGIYYDATRPSRLEHLLNHYELSAVEQKEAVQLIQSLRVLNMSKYNLAGNDFVFEQDPQQRKVILVTAQVEDDASILLGGVDIKTNAELLKAVRALQPDAYILYKTHPDVVAGLRKGHVDTSLIQHYADQTVDQVAITELLDVVDEVHTITSLSGFEALVRGKKVVCYGLPFYAGWGLTQDMHRCARRNRSLSLEALVYITLTQYAVYKVPETSGFASCMEAIQVIHAQKKHIAESSVGSYLKTKIMQIKHKLLQ